jgi:hypothetical protein
MRIPGLGDAPSALRGTTRVLARNQPHEAHEGAGRPDVDIPIAYTGVRPGDKRHEELLGDGEACPERGRREREPTSHPHIFRIRNGQRATLRLRSGQACNAQRAAERGAGSAAAGDACHSGGCTGAGGRSSPPKLTSPKSV